ncbi:NADP-dependent 3-hydroxy acid dehydrogenase YdfG [Desulfocicer vacuolatum DSM 3385]|uniref:NADP-dependent 3-hydroxy acid dehydrogenase YdfG n=1 Tax=Desulfocicer vacuolatum DSM 3385 TaxID=1121400 RepID=A0A1W2EL71_9BACT|nr:SDR family oxidoreductase [Desulfocicer vacuolatum]SMD09888.1 NADP-dependent 3-hydroxy acid dehydrogenase YdfG [Desulfocicer vacuolatum DSM 3385]
MKDRNNIFITGAASGIGRETALLFAANGWYVGIVDMNSEGLGTLEAEIGKENCFSRTMDVTDPVGYQKTVDAFAEKTNGTMDILFNNAGILRMGLNETIDLEQQHLTIDINIKGILNGIHASLPLLKKTIGARIISMCSTSSVYGMPELAVYSASKHAVGALTEAFDLEFQQYGIRVCDIKAPYIATPMVNQADQLAHSVVSTGVNLKPEQIAALVWKAAHGNKLHWKIHYLTHVLYFLFGLLPFLKRPVIKHLCLSKN